MPPVPSTKSTAPPAIAGWRTAYREARRLQRAHEKRAVVDNALGQLIERAFEVRGGGSSRDAVRLGSRF